MRPVLFDNAEGQHAHTLRLMNRLDEIGPGEFFPIWRKVGLRETGGRGEQENEHHEDCSMFAFHHPTLIKTPVRQVSRSQA